MNKKRKTIITISSLLLIIVIALFFLMPYKAPPPERKIISSGKQFEFESAKNYDTSNYPLVSSQDGRFSFRSPPEWRVKEKEADKNVIKLSSVLTSSCLLYVAIFKEQEYAQHLGYKIELVFSQEKSNYSVVEKSNRWGVLYQRGDGSTVRFPVDSKVYELGYQNDQNDSEDECQKAFYKLLNSVVFKYD